VFQLICRLLQQLSTVRKNQHTVSRSDSILYNFGKHNGFAAAGRQYQQSALNAAAPLVFHCLTSCLLVRSELDIFLPF
jgi:hypothetical protein